MHKAEPLALLCSFNEDSIAYANFKENTNYIKSKYKMAFVHTFNGKNSQLPQCWPNISYIHFLEIENSDIVSLNIKLKKRCPVYLKEIKKCVMTKVRKRIQFCCEVR